MELSVSTLDHESNRVTFSGSLLPEHVADLETTLGPLAGAARGNLYLDMAEVTYIASGALTVLLSVGQQLARSGYSIVLVRCQPDVIDLLAILELAPYFRVSDRLPERWLAVSSPSPAECRTADFPNSRAA